MQPWLHSTAVVKRRRPTFVLLLAVLGAATALATSPQAAPAARSGVPLTRVRDVSLPGHPTRFDYQTIDTAGRRLYIAHLGDSTLDAIDLDTLRVVATVPKISEVHGVAVAPDLGRVFATATGTNELVTIDTATNRIVARTPTGDFPDGVAYDRDDGLVFVSDKNAGSITVITAGTGSVTATIKVASETGNVTYDPPNRTVYAAARTPDRLVALDPTSRKVTTRIRLSGCDGAHGVYIDPSYQQAFVACERNARLVVVDLRRRRQTANVSVGEDPDVLAFDAALHRLYVASESGVVTVFTTSAKHPKKIGQAHLADAAHSLAVDQVTHSVYFPLQDVGGHPVLRVMRPAGSFQAASGSMGRRVPSSR
jgi:DNA-binding beta-propeller fold protein YncE